MQRLSLVAVLGISTIALAAPARAQSGVWPDGNRPSYVDEARQPYYESRRVAYDNGYNEGVKEGERDARDRDQFNYQDERAWQRADKGYHRSYGERSRYEQTFRTGFASGYSDAYRRYSPNYYPGGGIYPSTRGGYPNQGGYPSQGGYGYPGNGNRYPAGGYGYPQAGYGGARYGSPAHANGVNDGYEKGREDARDRDAYDPLRHKWYREGDHDYKNEYGSRQQYENLYREGFREGYDRGYREWRR